MKPLFMLMLLQLRSAFRRMTRGLRSVKGALLFVFGLLVIGLWIGPSIYTAHGLPRTDPNRVRDLAPIILLGTCLLTIVTSGGEKAIAFTPAEVDFLFPAPFTRRQILAYKVIKMFGGVVLSAALLSAVFLRHASSWMPAFTALLLGMMFMQLFGMAVMLVGQSIGERSYTLGRKLLLAAILIAVALSVLPVWMKGNPPGIIEISQMMRGHVAGRIVLAPLDVFGQLFTAQGAPGFLKFGGLALLVNVLLLCLVFFLDANYLEAAANRSQIVYAKLQRVRRGLIVAPSAKAAFSLSPFPHLGGAGPIFWRQCTTAIRSARGFIWLILIMAIAAGPLIFSLRNSEHLYGSVIGAMAWIALIAGGWMKFDFRGDVDQIDDLKSLPIPASAIAIGQLATPTILMTLAHALILAGVLGFSGRFEVPLRFVAAIALPFNALLFAVDNLIFLYFPSRMVASPADFQGYGRQIMVLMAKMGILLVAGGVTGLFAMIAHIVSKSLFATGAVAVVVLCGIVIAFVPLVAHAFKRFETPAA